MSCYQFEVQHGTVRTVKQGANIGGTGFYPGDALEVNCDMSYMLSSTTNTVTCTVNGWDKVPPQCLGNRFCI